MSVCMCTGARVCTRIWRPEAYIKFLSQSLATFLSEPGSLTEPGSSLVGLECLESKFGELLVFCLPSTDTITTAWSPTVLQTQVLALAWQTLYPMSHCPRCCSNYVESTNAKVREAESRMVKSRALEVRGSETLPKLNVVPVKRSKFHRSTGHQGDHMNNNVLCA